MSETIRLLLFSYGLLPDGSLHPQTVSRCLEAVRFSLERQLRGDVVIFYITVAYRDMGDKMKECLLSLGVAPGRIYFDPRGVGTKGEIEIFLNKVSTKDVLGAVSSWYHLPRVGMLFRKFGRKAIWLEAAHGHVSWKQDVLKEILKYFNDLFNRRPLAWYEKYRAWQAK